MTMTPGPGAVTSRQIIRRTLARNRRSVIVGTTLVCVHQLAETAVPMVLGVLIDRGVASKDFTALVVSVAVLAVLFLVLTTSFQVGMRILNVALQREGHLLRMEVSERALAPQGIRTDLGNDELLTISSSDAEQASWFLDLFPRMAAAATAVAATAVALLIIDVPLGLAVLVGVPLFLALLRVATPLITRRAEAQQSRVAKATAMAGDFIVGLRSIKGIGSENAASRRYSRASASALDATLSTVAYMSAQRGVTTAISSLIAATIAIVAGWFALSGRISNGELIAVAGLAQFLIEPLTLLSTTPAIVAKARGSAERVATVLNAPHLVDDRDGVVPESGADLCLRDVEYRSLRSVSIDVPCGSLIAVFPFNRADGDALAELLSGHVASGDYTGALTLGGVDLREAGRESVRRHMIAEPHLTDLFAGTVQSNIAPSTETPDSELLSVVASAAAADQVIEQHADGLSHELHARGQNLSGGQRQRLALARALYSRAPLLILHEPTTAVDAVTEQIIADGIVETRHGPDALRDEATTIIITPSPTLLAVADAVVVLRDGTVESVGTHAELLSGSAEYAQAVLR